MVITPHGFFCVRSYNQPPVVYSDMNIIYKMFYFDLEIDLGGSDSIINEKSLFTCLPREVLLFRIIFSSSISVYLHNWTKQSENGTLSLVPLTGKIIKC